MPRDEIKFGGASLSLSLEVDPVTRSGPTAVLTAAAAAAAATDAAPVPPAEVTAEEEEGMCPLPSFMSTSSCRVIEERSVQQ